MKFKKDVRKPKKQKLDALHLKAGSLWVAVYTTAQRVKRRFGMTQAGPRLFYSEVERPFTIVVFVRIKNKQNFHMETFSNRTCWDGEHGQKRTGMA